VWNATRYDEFCSFVTNYGAALLTLLDPKPGERILDLGCGTGHLTNDIAKSGATVVGIDSSPDMIAKASAAYPEIPFVVENGTSFRTDEPFDAVFSNAALHWMKPPEAVVQTIASALKPGGRFVAEFGGKGNVRSVTDVLGSHPWYYPSVGEYATLLERHGIDVETAALFPRPTPIEGESALHDWFKMFYAAPLIDGRFEQIEHALRPKLYRDGTWYMDYVRLRITARKG